MFKTKNRVETKTEMPWDKKDGFHVYVEPKQADPPIESDGAAGVDFDRKAESNWC